MAVVRILLVWLFVAECWVQHTTGSCPTGKFGDSCFYSCHCGDSCDQTTGVCEVGCDADWVGGHGATCQKDNIAKGKSATSQSGAYTAAWSADKAVDGNRNQDVNNNFCFHSSTIYPSVWTVDLGKPYRIHDVRIYHRTGFINRLQTAVLSLSNSNSSTPGVTCYTFPPDTAKTDNSVYDVTCDGTGKYFTITHNTKTLNLCEVEIYVCSHGTFGELCNHFCHCSDGPCDRLSGICAGDCRPGWQGQNCSTACDKDRYGVNCNETCGNRKCAAAPSSCDRHTGSCDTGCLPGWTEVDCKQECSLGTYGQNCSKQCTQRNCAGNSSCDHVTGKCVTRCKPGWMGIDCIQACEPHRYGPNCDKACASRHCAGNSSCNTRGDCDTGCETGWTLDDCTACDSQHYGANCVKTCTSRHCIGDSSCNTTGHCDSGCEGGWTLPDCTECNNGIYGTDCNMTCSERKCAGDSSCDHVRGKCTSGCVSGWKGEDCTTASLPQQNNQVGGEGILIPAVTVTTIVVLVVAGAAVGVVIWRRRRRSSLQESDSHDYYNTSHLSKVPTKQSRDNDETQLEDRTYDGLSVMSREIQGPGETYCTLNTEKPVLEGGACGEVAETTDWDIYEPTEPRTYETLDNTSRDIIGEYSELGKIT